MNVYQSPPTAHVVAMLLYDGVAASDVAGPLECFGLANYLSGRSLYQICTFTLDGAPVNAGGAWLGLAPNCSAEGLPANLHTLLVPGGPAVFKISQDPAFTRWLAARANTVERIGSICNGTFLLAAAGLTKGRRVATHWVYANELARQHPETDVDADALFVQSGPLWSSGGMSAGMDLALAIIEADFGRTLAMEVARMMVLYMRRAGGQNQFSVHLQSQFADIPMVERIRQIIMDDPAGDHRIETLAKNLAMSERTMLRLFKESTGQTIGEFVIGIRLRTACTLLETSYREVKEIAILSGLGTEANMRRTFMSRLKVSPTEYRDRFRLETEGAGLEHRQKLGYDDHWLHRYEVMDFRKGGKPASA